jgi:hypothetical protein
MRSISPIHEFQHERILDLHGRLVILDPSDS